MRKRCEKEDEEVIYRKTNPTREQGSYNNKIPTKENEFREDIVMGKR